MTHLIPTLLTLLSSQAFAQAPNAVLLYSQKDSPAPLTTSLFRRIAPKQSNPHRYFWWVNRDVRFEKVATIPHEGGYRPVIRNVLAPTTLYIRASGNWESDWKEFTCAPDADPFFVNRDGAKIAANFAAEQWQALLHAKFPLLKILISKIHTPSAVQAERAAWAVLDRWKADLETEFKVKSQLEARGKEWSFYRLQAQKNQLCRGDQPVETPLPPKSWRDRMEPLPMAEASPSPSSSPSSKNSVIAPVIRKPKLLARSPAERVGGLYVVRLSMRAGDRVLNGQFIVDSAAGASLISPSFLERQGVKVADVEVKGVAPQKVRGINGTSFARLVALMDPKLSSHALETKKFLMVDTQLFEPPEYRISCCDGVLGADFLEGYAVEFLSYPRPTVLLWEKEGYFKTDAKGNLEPWIEVSRLADGDLISEGILEWDGKKDAVSAIGLLEGKMITQPVRFRWDTGNDTSVLLHEPWGGPAEGPHWSLIADRIQLARDFEMDFHRGFMNRQAQDPKIAAVTLAEQQSPFTQKDPAFTVGMRLLDRSSFVLDLANGRVWLSKEALARPVIENRTGLELRYVNDSEGDRSLIVFKMKKESVFGFLQSAGFQEGTQVTFIGGKPANYWNQGEVNRFLSNRPGTKLKFRWKSPQGETRDAEITLP